MRVYIAQAIAKDTVLRGMGLVESAVYSAENVETPPERPFIVIRWIERYASIRQSPSQTNPVDIWVYDTPGDFSRIDGMIARIKDILTPIQAQETSTGWITQVDWANDGRDAYDDVYRAINRTTSYRVVASYAVDVP